MRDRSVRLVVGCSTRGRLSAFAASGDGAASIELAAGAVVLVAVSALCFDLYSRVQANAAVLRMAVTMADYASRDAETSGDDLSEVGTFLYTHELGVPAHLIYVLTALRKPDGDPAASVDVLWTDNSIRIGAETETDELAGLCPRRVNEGGNANLPEMFHSGMESGEVVIVAEVCARLSREGSIVGQFIADHIYRFHALPSRDPEADPAAPVFSSTDQARVHSDRHHGISHGGGMSDVPTEPRVQRCLV